MGLVDVASVKLGKYLIPGYSEVFEPIVWVRIRPNIMELAIRSS
jgi:hypothetical protein